MANDEHVKLLRGGALRVREWRARNPNAVLDLAGANLDGFELAGYDLSHAILTGTSLVGANISSTNFTSANLQQANLKEARASSVNFANANLEHAKIISISGENARFEGANLGNTDLSGSTLSDSHFDKANIFETNFRYAHLNRAEGLPLDQLSTCILDHTNLDDVDLSGVELNLIELDGASFRRCKLRRAQFTGSKMANANFSEANLQDADLEEADLTNAELERTDLSRVNLRHSILRRANLTDTNLAEADVDDADIMETRIVAASFLGTKNVDKLRHMDTTQISKEVQYFDSLNFSTLNRYLGWERLRSVGKLPLFGASYAALIAIPIFFYGLDFYNQKVVIVRSWAEARETQTSGSELAMIILSKLHSQPIPSRSHWIWIAAVCLGIASTIYSLACPTRVREFSRDQWRDQLSRPVFHYVSHSWRTPVLRIVTAFFYTIGGTLALWLISEKMFQVLVFILRNYP